MNARVSIAAATAWAMAFATPGLASGTTQENAQLQAAYVNYVGSDNSMESATNRAMVAMMNLAALNIPGAFANGYKAYGHYINSEKMDDIEAKALRLQGKMAGTRGPNKGGSSGASGQGQKDRSSGISGTTFSRLKTDFLYKGEMAEVAAEFEKRSGMKREEFLQHLASATDARLRWDDPQLMQKLESRFQAFTSRIPNKEFREGLETAANMFPSAARTETLQKIASVYFDAWGSRGGGEAVAQAPNGEAGAADAAQAVAEGEARARAEYEPFTGAGGAGSARAPAAVAEAAINRSGLGMLGLKADSGEALGDLFNAPEDSLFRRVSKRYRDLTPLLVGRSTVLNSK
jgi:hypothetical protein